MKHFFDQAQRLSEDTSQNAVESFFRGQNASGLIEKQLHSGKSAILLFANGSPSAAYQLENGLGTFITHGEFSAVQNEIANVRALQLPDVAGRLTLLALESQIGDELAMPDSVIWQAQLEKWKQARWSGLVEVESNDLQGLALFWQGELQTSDVIFSTASGFVTELPKAGIFPWKVTTYLPVPTAQGYQCAILRLGAVHWSFRILIRYQEMVGQKLLQTMDRELNRQIQPWRWKIALTDSNMLDTHFFPYLMDAAHAYRALFMAMGAQMNFVIGSNLTLRLLNETFEQIHPDERALLQSQRLIPAAFSE